MAEADCGCRVEIGDDEIHVWPCGPDHEPAIVGTARDKATELALELVVEPMLPLEEFRGT